MIFSYIDQNTEIIDSSYKMENALSPILHNIKESKFCLKGFWLALFFLFHDFFLIILFRL